MTKNLNVSNEDCLIYEHEFLRVSVLGGIKLEGLDRLRVTLKIVLPDTNVPPVRHNLDLYNDTQMEKLIRKVSERLEIGTSVVHATLTDLTEVLENYRLERIEENAPKGVEAVVLSKEEEKAAKDFLCEPNLLERTNELIGRSGVIGETTNRLLMYLIYTSRKTAKPLHVVSLASSGTGKTHLQESVANLIPEEDRVELTSLSENAFYYFERKALAHKLILIEDLDGAESVLYPLRELQSKQRISKTVAHKSSNGETKTMHLVVEGPVSVAGCTTHESIYEDNANRSFLLYLDESEDQDMRIMEYQRMICSGELNTDEQAEIRTLLQNTQRVLSPIKVVNAYASKLKLPSVTLKPRRTNNHYLQFIEAVTFYHQHQRTQCVDAKTGEVYIETTIEDIKAANELLHEVLIRKSDRLTGACRNYFEVLKTFLLGAEQQTFSNREMSLKLSRSIATVKRHHLDLYNCGYLRIVKRDKLQGYEYEIVSYDEYKQLQESIDTVLDKAVKNLKKGK